MNFSLASEFNDNYLHTNKAIITQPPKYVTGRTHYRHKEKRQVRQVLTDEGQSHGQIYCTIFVFYERFVHAELRQASHLKMILLLGLVLATYGDPCSRTFEQVERCLQKRGCFEQADRYSMRYRGYWFGISEKVINGEETVPKCHSLRHYCKPRLGRRTSRHQLIYRKSNKVKRKTKLCPTKKGSSKDCFTLKNYYPTITECERQITDSKK